MGSAIAVAMTRMLDFNVRTDGARGPLIAQAYVRLLIGGRGPYVEFLPEHIIKDQIEVEPGQEYRLTDEWRKKAFYAWYRTKVGHRKVYEQFKYVGYADYVPTYFYISPDDLVFNGELYVEVSKKMAKKNDVPQINFDL
jgi:hypothetical protein